MESFSQEGARIMLYTAGSDQPKPSNGRIEGSYAHRTGWSPIKTAVEATSLRIYLGDEHDGPLVWAFFVGPLETTGNEPRPEFRPAQAHYHRSPTFRVALGSQPKQFKFDQDCYGSDDYILLDANRFYQDPMGVDGAEVLLMFADRRAYPPTNRKIADLSSDEIMDRYAEVYGDFGAAIRQVTKSDDDADLGVSTSSFGKLRAGRLKGSLQDPSTWSQLPDGSHVAAAVLGSKLGAPLLLMSSNAPGAEESPAGIASSDFYRIVTKGSCTIGDRTYEAGSFVAIEAGMPVGPVVHGPEGSRQIFLAADRRKWRQVNERSEPVPSERQDDIAKVIAEIDGA